MSKLRALLVLGKARIGVLILVTTSLGYCVADTVPFDVKKFLFTLLGTFISCAGAAALNNFLERDIDGKMVRTRLRPLQTGAITPNEALMFGVFGILGGVLLLAFQVNLLAAFLALLTCFLYVLVYTPLKRVTWFNTTVGAIPGALPPMGGWAAATGELGFGAWVLFLLLFIWQHPHFFSIAWMYREDYRNAGIKMLPAVEPDGRRTFFLSFAFSVALIPSALLLPASGISGLASAIGVAFLALMMAKKSVDLERVQDMVQARGLLHSSLIYLPALVFLIALDRLLLA